VCVIAGISSVNVKCLGNIVDATLLLCAVEQNIKSANVEIASGVGGGGFLWMLLTI